MIKYIYQDGKFTSISHEELLAEFSKGTFVVSDFITEKEELELIELLDKENWRPSQSGRMKIDFGVSKVNFKKKKVKTDQKHIT